MSTRLSRRDFLSALGAGALALPGCVSSGRRVSATNVRGRPPNIILILTDDLGYGDLGCYGQNKIRTPNLDPLAAAGVRFTQYYAGSTVCAPSRCCLLTGLHTGHAYIRDNGEIQPEGQTPLPENTVTIGRLLQSAGYRTAAIGKWGLGGPGSTGEPNRQGFDYWFGYLCQRHAHNHYPTYLWRNTEKVMLEGNTKGNLIGEQYAPDLMREDALRFIRENRDRPFFLYYATTIPHLALQVPEDSLAEYRGLWPDPPYEGGKGYLPQATPRAAYAAMITRMDRDIGALRSLLVELGLAEQTLVLFMSDNGATFGLGGYDPAFFVSNSPLRGRKMELYEGGIRVPLIACWPGHIAPAAPRDHVCAAWDVLPTLTQLAGIPTPANTDGISFLPTLLAEPHQERHRYLYWEYADAGSSQAVRLGNWKGLRRKLATHPDVLPELYDLAGDIGESRDVAASHPAVVAEISEIMRTARTDSELFPLPGVSAPKT